MNVTYPLIRFELADGETLEFVRNQIINAQLVEENKPISIDLPISKLEFKIDVPDDTFSMFTTTTLPERTPIMAYEIINGVTNLLGRFYLDTWKNTSQRNVEFTAVDIIGILEETDFDGAFFSSSISLFDALNEIFTPINITFDFDESFDFGDVYIKGWIPAGNYRSALQQLCFAGNATAYTSRSEKIKIANVSMPNSLYDYRLRNSKKINKSVEKLPLISRIEIVSHNYTEQATSETIFEQYLEAGSYKIIFDKPYTDIVISGSGYTPTTITTEGGENIITENGDFIEAGGEFVVGSNSVYLTLQIADTVIITGYPWLDSKHSFIFNETNTNETNNKSTILISNATLISTDNGQTVLNNVRDYYRQRYVQKVKLLPSDIRTGNVILSDTYYGKQVLGSNVKMVIGLTGGFLADTEIRGILPNYAQPLENPVRRFRAGVAISGAGLTRSNKWRNY